MFVYFKGTLMQTVKPEVEIVTVFHAKRLFKITKMNLELEVNEHRTAVFFNKRAVTPNSNFWPKGDQHLYFNVDMMYSYFNCHIKTQTYLYVIVSGYTGHWSAWKDKYHYTISIPYRNCFTCIFDCIIGMFFFIFYILYY